MMRKLQISILMLGLFGLIGIQSAFAQINYKAANANNFAGKWNDIYNSGLGKSVSFQNYDDATSDNAESIGFNFDFNGQTYTDVRINTNGFLKFGSVVPTMDTLFYTTSTSTVRGALNSPNAADSNILAVFNHDLEPGASKNPYVYIYTTGNAGSRVCTIQWGGFRDKTTNPAIQYDEIAFQVKLYETSNIIEYVYGPFIASANANNFKTVAVGLKGSNNNSASLLVATKGSTGAWSTTQFLDGNYTGNAHNIRNNAQPDSGRTYAFVPTQQRDIAVVNIYSLGKLPVPFAVPHDIEVQIKNTGVDSATNFTIYINTTGANAYQDSFVYNAKYLKAGATENIYFKNYSPTVTGFDTIAISINDGNPYNNKTYAQNVNLNSYSYIDITQPPAGGVGFTGGTGDFVARFNSTNLNYINQIKVNFQSNNLDYKIGIWDIDTLTGRPKTNLWTSAGFKTFPGQAVISVNPPVQVQGSFFVGVRQTGTQNCAFAFQYETPIRDSSFYYTAPVGGTVWTDFATLGTTNFRFMIEPRLMLVNDIGVIKIVSPTKDTCAGGKMMDLVLQVQNLGADSIDFSTDSVEVYAFVKDAYGDTMTIGPKVLNSGVLHSNDTLDVTITSQFDMTTLGDYEITGYTVWSKDINYQNDTIPMEIRKSTGATAEAVALTNTSICNGDTVVMSAAASVNGITFQWLYNGSPINNAIDTGYYATVGGDYSCLVINGYGCSAISDTISVKIKNAPAPNLLYTNNGFCPGDSLKIIASTNNTTYTYEWYYNNSILSGKTDSIIYAGAAGDYFVKVTDNTTGCSGVSSTLKVSAGSTPDTTITVGSNKICNGDSTSLTAVAGVGYLYQWSLNGNTINGATSNKYYAKAAGTYTVQITSNFGCKASNKGVSIAIDSSASNKITTSNGTFHFCDQDSLVLYAATGTGYKYQWSDNGGPISGETNSSLKVFLAGDYSVAITNSNGCVTNSGKITVTTGQAPNVTMKAIANTQFCQGDSILLESATSTTGDSYQWAKNNTDVNGATAASYYVKTGGDYILKITNSSGCTGASIPATITELASPNPTVQAKKSPAICAGDSVELDMTASSSVQSTQWKLNGTDISGANGSSIMVKAAGSYTAFVTGTNTCSGTSNAISVTVNPLPTATASYASKTLTAGTGTGYTYQWYKDGAPIAGANAATYIPTTNGKYTVLVSDGNGCSKLSNEVTVTDLGVAIEEYINLVNVYPNPSNGVYTLNLGMNNLGSVRIRTMDLTGKIITDEMVNMNKGNNFHQVDLSGFAKGIYMLNIEVKGSNANFKLIKE